MVDTKVRLILCGGSRLLAALLVVCWMQSSTRAMEFTVATNGSDTDPGTKAQPFRTIQHAAEVMQPGDTCMIRGGVHRETVRPKVSGDPGKPLRFAAFGNETVTVSGADALSSDWSVHNGSIYKATTDRRFIQLFVDGKMMQEARWPNSPPEDVMRMNRAEAGPGTDYDTLADPSLPPGDWSGALVLLWPGSRWTNSTRRIVDYAPGKGFRFDRTLRREKADPYHEKDPYRPQPGNPFILFGSLAGLDSPGEWYLDSAKGIIYLWSVGGESPAAHAVEVKQRDLAFDLSGLGNIEVRGLRIFAAAISMTDAHDCVIEDCHLRYPEHLREIDGYKMPPIKNVVTGRNNEWRRCSIVYSATTALRLAGENNRITNSIVHDANYLGTSRGALELSGTGAVVRQCSLYRAGRDIVQHGGAKKIRVEYNDIHHANMLNNDSGATYAWGTDGEGSIIAWNWVHDNLGDSTNGIYLDNFCKNFIVHHNVVWNNNGNGIRLNSDATNHLICNNTLTKNLTPFGVYTYSGRIPTQKGTRIINNLIIGRLKQSDPQVFVQGELAPDVHHNGCFPMDSRAVPAAASGAIDAGIVVPGITDGYKGKAPDVGAYESGDKYWTAGADWKDEAFIASPPMDLRFEPRKPVTESSMILDGLQLWLDAADVKSVEVDVAGNLRRWKDKSLKGHDASPGGGAKACALQRDAIEGKPVIHFGGVASLKLGTFRPGATPVTTFVVSRGREGAGAPWQRILGAYGGKGIEWEAPNWIIVRPGGGKPEAYEAQVFSVKRRNGCVLAGLVLGGSTVGEHQFLDGDVAEVLVYDRCLAEEEEDAILDYLGRKWGIKNL